MLDPAETIQAFAALREHVYVSDRETLRLMVTSVLELVE
jgi:hypothetical protein